MLRSSSFVPLTKFLLWRRSWFGLEVAGGGRPYFVEPLKVFTQRNFVVDFFREKLNFTGTNSDITFLYHPLGDLGVTHTVHLWLVGKRVVDFL